MSKKGIILTYFLIIFTIISLEIVGFFICKKAVDEVNEKNEIEIRNEQLIKLDLTIHYGFEPVYWDFTKIEFEEREAYLVKVYTYEQTGGPHSVHPVEWKFFAAVEEEKDGTYDVDTEEIYTRERLYK